MESESTLRKEEDLLKRPSFRSPYLEALEEAPDFSALAFGGESEVYYTLKDKLKLLVEEGVCAFTREEANKACVPLLDLWDDFGVLSKEPPIDLMRKAFVQGNVDVLEWCKRHSSSKIRITTPPFHAPTEDNLFQDIPELLRYISSPGSSSVMKVLIKRKLKTCFRVWLGTYLPWSGQVRFPRDTTLFPEDPESVVTLEDVVFLLEAGRLSLMDEAIYPLLIYLESKDPKLDRLNSLWKISGADLGFGQLVFRLCVMSTQKDKVGILSEILERYGNTILDTDDIGCLEEYLWLLALQNRSEGVSRFLISRLRLRVSLLDCMGDILRSGYTEIISDEHIRELTGTDGVSYLFSLAVPLRRWDIAAKLLTSIDEDTAIRNLARESGISLKPYAVNFNIRKFLNNVSYNTRYYACSPERIAGYKSPTDSEVYRNTLEYIVCVKGRTDLLGVLLRADNVHYQEREFCEWLLGLLRPPVELYSSILLHLKKEGLYPQVCFLMDVYKKMHLQP